MYRIICSIKDLCSVIVESPEAIVPLLMIVIPFILIFLMFFIVYMILYDIYQYRSYIYMWSLSHIKYVVITIGVICLITIYLNSSTVILVFSMTMNNPDLIINNYYGFMTDLYEDLSSTTVNNTEDIYYNQFFMILFNNYCAIDTLEPLIMDQPITINKGDTNYALTTCPSSGKKIATINYSTTTTAFFPVSHPNYTYVESTLYPEAPANSRHLRLPFLPMVPHSPGMLDGKIVQLPDINILRGYDGSHLKLSANDLKLRVMWNYDLQTYTNFNNVPIEKTNYGWRAYLDINKFVMVDGFTDGAKKEVLYDKSPIQDALRARIADSLRDLQSQGYNYLQDNNIPFGMRTYCFQMFRNNGIPIPFIDGSPSFTGIPINETLFKSIERAQP